MARLLSEEIQVEDSFEAINELFYQRGWTDGLPIVPPTEDRIQRMLSAVRRDPAEVIAELPPAQGEASVEKIAINAVMAGCLPAYMPVLIAAMQAMSEPQFDLYHTQATTNAVGPLAIINGPIRKALEINCGYNCLGPGWRANAALGRAIRLILLNIGGGVPGTVDKATHGQPGKYSFCFGENEEESPWEPLHVERDFPHDASTVTMVGACGTLDIVDAASKSAESLLQMVATSVAVPGSTSLTHPYGEPLVVLGPEHASIVAREGWSKLDVKRYIYENSAVPASTFPKEHQEWRIARWGWAVDGKIYPAESPDGVMIVVAGGAGIHSVSIPTSKRSVTKAITI